MLRRIIELRDDRKPPRQKLRRRSFLPKEATPRASGVGQEWASAPRHRSMSGMDVSFQSQHSYNPFHSFHQDQGQSMQQQTQQDYSWTTSPMSHGGGAGTMKHSGQPQRFSSLPVDGFDEYALNAASSQTGLIPQIPVSGYDMIQSTAPVDKFAMHMSQFPTLETPPTTPAIPVATTVQSAPSMSGSVITGRSRSDSYDPNSDRFSFQQQPSTEEGTRTPWPDNTPATPTSTPASPITPLRETEDAEDSVGNLSTIPEEPVSSSPTTSLVAPVRKPPSLALSGSVPTGVQPLTTSPLSPSSNHQPHSAPPKHAAEKAPSLKSHSRIPSWRHSGNLTSAQPMAGYATVSTSNPRHQRRSTFGMLSRTFFMRPTSSKLSKGQVFEQALEEATVGKGDESVVTDEASQISSQPTQQVQQPNVTITTTNTSFTAIDENTTMANLPDIIEPPNLSTATTQVDQSFKTQDSTSRSVKGNTVSPNTTPKSRKLSGFIPASPAMSSRTEMSMLLPSQQQSSHLIPNQGGVSPNASARTLNSATVHADDPDWYCNNDLVNWMHGQAHWSETAVAGAKTRERMGTDTASIRTTRRRPSTDTTATGNPNMTISTPSSPQKYIKPSLPLAHFHTDRDMPSHVTVTIDHPLPPSPTSLSPRPKLYIHILDVWTKGLPFESVLTCTLTLNSHPRGPIAGISARNERRGYNASAKFSEALLLDVLDDGVALEMTIWARLPERPKVSLLPKVPGEGTRKKRHRLFSHRPEGKTQRASVLGLWGANAQNGPAGYLQQPQGAASPAPTSGPVAHQHAQGSIKNSFSISKMLSRSTTASTLYSDHHDALRTAATAGGHAPARSRLGSSMLSTSSSTATSQSIVQMADATVPSDAGSSLVLARLTLDAPATLFRPEARTYPLHINAPDTWTHALTRFEQLAKVEAGSDKDRRKAESKAKAVSAERVNAGATMVSAEVTVKVGVYEEFMGERLARELASTNESLFADYLTVCMHNSNARVPQSWKRYWISLERGGSLLVAYDFEYKSSRSSIFSIDLVFLPANSIKTTSSSDDDYFEFFPVPNGLEVSLNKSVVNGEDQFVEFNSQAGNPLTTRRLWDDHAVMRAYADDANALTKWIKALTASVPTLRKLEKKEPQGDPDLKQAQPIPIMSVAPSTNTSFTSPNALQQPQTVGAET